MIVGPAGFYTQRGIQSKTSSMPRAWALQPSNSSADCDPSVGAALAAVAPYNCRMPEFEVNPPVPCSICGELKEPEELSDLDGQLACLDCIAQANVSKNVPLEKLAA